MDFSLAPITIQQIIVFLCVVEYEGFAKASGYLHMTQSAVSKSIAKLEKELGIVLFQRTTREIHLTEAGKVLYEEWKVQIREMHNSYIKAASLQKEEHSMLRVGVLNTARPERYFWSIEERFKKQYPEISLELASEYMTDLEDKLELGEYDAIMIPDFERFAVEKRGLLWCWAACSHAYVYMSSEHPLAKKNSLQTIDILNEDFVTLEHGHKGSHERDLEARMAMYHVQPKIVSHYKNAYEIKYLFRTGTPALLFADNYFDFPDTPGVVHLPVMDQMNGIICAWNPNNLKEPLKKFIQILESGLKTEE